MTHRSNRAPMRVMAIAAAAVVPFAAAVPAEANPLGLPLRLTNDPLDEIQSQDQVIAAGKTTSLIVYERHQGAFGRGLPVFDLMAQVVDADGKPVGAPASIDPADNGVLSDPDVAYNATRDEYYVVWRRDDVFFRGSDEAVRGVRLSATGAQLGSATNLGSVDEPDDPRVAWSSTDDDYLAVWEEDSDEDLFGVEIAGDGTPGTEDLNFTDDDSADPDDPARPDVAHDPVSDRWLVAYYADRLDDNTTDRSLQSGGVYGQLFDGNADDATDVFPIDADNDRGADEPSIAARGADGGFRVAYAARVDAPLEPERVILGSRSTREVFTRDVDGSGGVAATAAQVSSQPADEPNGTDSSAPAIARDTVTGDYLVVWQWEGFQDTRGAAENAGVFGRSQASDGTASAGGDQKVSDQAALGLPFLGARDAVVAYNPGACQFTTAWEGDAPTAGAPSRSIAVRSDVFTRGYDAPDCPKAATGGGTITSTSTTTVTPTTQTAASQQAFVKPPRRCLSRRLFRVNTLIRKGLSFRTLAVTLAGKGLDVEVPEGRRLSFRVDMRGFVPGVYTLTIRAGLSNGRTLRQTRRYRACAVGRTTRLVKVDP